MVMVDGRFLGLVGMIVMVADLCLQAGLVGKGSGTYPSESHLPVLTLDILTRRPSTIRGVFWWFERDLLPLVTPC